MGEVSVRFLGSGDAFGSGGRFQTCIYVQTDGPSPTHLLMDCGASSLIAMKRFGVETSTIDAILLSHLHGDHFGGLPFFIMEAHYISNRERALVIAGPPGLETRIQAAMEILYPGSTEVQRAFDLEYIELQDGTPAAIGPISVTPYRVAHPSGAPSYALRVSHKDKVLAFSGDTAWTDALTRASTGADLFICECYHFEKSGGHHLDYETLMQHRAELGCRRLVLTHMSDEMLEQIQSLDTEGAADGKSYVL